MRGTRYGDFSRLTPDPGARFSGVLAQQGRVQLDRDVNDAAEILAGTLRRALADVLGGSCVPERDPGFAIAPEVGLVIDSDTRVAFPELADVVTLELWLAWHEAGTLLSWRDTAADRELALVISAEGTIVLHGPDGAVVQGGPVPRGRSTHVALVGTGTELLVFADGSEALRTARAGWVPPAQGSVELGAPSRAAGRGFAGAAGRGFAGAAGRGFAGAAGRGFAGAAGNGFAGVLTGTAMWHAPQSRAAIAWGARAGMPGTDVDGLAALWTLDEGTGAMPRDAVHGLTASVVGGVRWEVIDLTINPGRMYVDGVLCSLAQPQRYTQQPDGPAALPAEPGRYLAFLEAWEDTVTAVEAPELLEVALGGPDTTVRTVVSHRVRLAPLTGDDLERTAWDTVGHTSGRLAAEHTGAPLPVNGLYRVEVHRSGVVGRSGEAPALKWSRDNGASLFRVEPVEDRPGDEAWYRIVAGPQTVEPLRRGDLVEVVGSAPDGVPAALAEVAAEGPEDEGTIAFAAALPAGTYLRRWDGQVIVDRDGPASGEGWAELENGIRVHAGDGAYRRGDYWWIVARQDLGTIEWPQLDGHPADLPPMGVERLLAPLAVLTISADGVEVRDVRRRVVGLAGDPDHHHGPPAPPKPPRPPAPPHPKRELAWRALGHLELPPHELQSAADVGNALVVASATHVFTLSGAALTSQDVMRLPHERHGAVLCVVNDHLFLVGGGPKPGHPDGKVYVLDATDTPAVWVEQHAFPIPRDEAAVVGSGHLLHVIGGRHSGVLRHHTHAAHEVFDPSANRWADAPKLPEERWATASGVLGDFVHVAGGRGPGHHAPVERDHFAFDLRRGAWSHEPPLPHHHAVADSCVHAGRFLVLLERDDEPQSLVSYHADTRTWHDLPVLPVHLKRPMLFVRHGEVHVLGTDHEGKVALFELAMRDVPKGPPVPEHHHPEPEPAHHHPEPEPEHHHPEPEHHHPAPEPAHHHPEPEPAHHHPAPAPAQPAAWRPLGHLELTAADLSAAASFAGALVVTSATEMFAVSPRKLEVIRIGALPEPRIGAVLCVAGDMLILAGGGPKPDEPDGKTFIFDPTHHTWHASDPFPLRRSGAAIAAADGFMHVLGGRRSGRLRDHPRAAHEIFDPRSGHWRDAPELPKEASGMAAGQLGERLHVVGGHGAGHPAAVLTEHVAFDLKAGTWATEPALPFEHPIAGSCVHDGRLVIALARPHEPQVVVGYDAEHEQWHRLPSLPAALATPLLVEHDSELLVVGAHPDGRVVVYELT